MSDDLWQAERCRRPCVFAGIFTVGLVGRHEPARPVWLNTGRIWENTQRSRWKKLCFCEHVSQSQGDKGNPVLGWAGAEEVAGVLCEDRSHHGGLVTVPGGELCSYADVFVYAPSRLRSNRTRSERPRRLPRPEFTCAASAIFQSRHLLSAQLCWDSCIWVTDQELRHPSPWRQNLRAALILYVRNKTVTETLLRLLSCQRQQWSFSEDSALIHFSSLKKLKNTANNSILEPIIVFLYCNWAQQQLQPKKRVFFSWTFLHYKFLHHCLNMLNLLLTQLKSQRFLRCCGL